jgi:hypothetical protein
MKLVEVVYSIRKYVYEQTCSVWLIRYTEEHYLL